MQFIKKCNLKLWNRFQAITKTWQRIYPLFSVCAKTDWLLAIMFWLKNLLSKFLLEAKCKSFLKSDTKICLSRVLFIQRIDHWTNKMNRNWIHRLGRKENDALSLVIFRIANYELLDTDRSEESLYLQDFQTQKSFFQILNFKIESLWFFSDFVLKCKTLFSPYVTLRRKFVYISNLF